MKKHTQVNFEIHEYTQFTHMDWCKGQRQIVSKWHLSNNLLRRLCEIGKVTSIKLIDQKFKRTNIHVELLIICTA